MINYEVRYTIQVFFPFEDRTIPHYPNWDKIGTTTDIEHAYAVPDKKTIIDFAHDWCGKYGWKLLTIKRPVAKLDK